MCDNDGAVERIMNTPVCDFLKKNRKIKNRFYMPGHKGKYPDDITEIDGADVLYNPNGIIAESEKNASEIFGSGKTAYSTEGSSLPIRATLFLVKSLALSYKKKPIILASRNVHSSFISACALNDITPEWIYGEEKSILSSFITADELNDALIKTKAVAFYLTSPDYLGYMANISAFSEVCHKNGALFIVDNAHGAYLHFLPSSFHPLSYGADIVIDSAHKTLTCITGTAYLHVGKNAPDFLKENLNYALSLFASTSPSYLMIASLDAFNLKSELYKNELLTFIPKVSLLKENLSLFGYEIIGNEPLKLTIQTKKYGYYGYEIANILKSKKIIVEFYDDDYITFMFSPCNTTKQLKGLEKALKSILRKEEILTSPPTLEKNKRVLSIREAVFSPSEEISVEKAKGRVLSQLILSCPPAIPIAISGEKLNENSIELLKYYRISKIKVVK